MPQTSHTLEILLVEDNPGDANLTRIALEEGSIDVNLSVVTDGVEAIEFLNRQGKYHQAIHPDLILLDWHLPRKNGREVLLEIKTDPELRLIPVVVLTTAQADEDILKAYNLYANYYLAKPLDSQQFSHIVRSIVDS